MSDVPANPLLLDPPEAIDRILRAIRFHVHSSLKKRGAVVAISGGIDSAVCASLCVAALGPERVFALSLPERHSSPESAKLASELADQLGIQLLKEEMGPLLDAAGCYRRQAEAIREVFPEYQDNWSFHIVLPPLLSGERLNLPRLIIKNEHGDRLTRRIPPGPYLQIIAATNFKQRSRTMTAYYHADRLHYAFCGTPNRLEYELGFFVKGTDSPTSNPLPICTNPRYIRSGKRSPFRGVFFPVDPQQIHFPSNRHKKSSTSRFPWRFWTHAFTGSHMLCRLQMLRQESDSPKSRWHVCIGILRASAARRSPCISHR